MIVERLPEVLSDIRGKWYALEIYLTYLELERLQINLRCGGPSVLSQVDA